MSSTCTHTWYSAKPHTSDNRENRVPSAQRTREADEIKFLVLPQLPKSEQVVSWAIGLTTSMVLDNYPPARDRVLAEESERILSRSAV